MPHYTVEAIYVGLGLTVLGLIVSYTIISAQTPSTYPDRNAWVKMSMALFVTGALFHVLAEVSGLNKWYCTQGYACMKKN